MPRRLPAGPAPAESNNKNKKKESFLSSTCGFGMIQRYEGLWGPVKLQRSIVNPIISRAWIRIQDFYPGSKQSFLNILNLGSLQCQTWDFSSLNPFQTWDSQATETGVKPKNKAWTSDKTLSEKFFLFSCGFIEDLLQPTSFKSSSSRFSKILHNFKFGWTPSR